MAAVDCIILLFCGFMFGIFVAWCIVRDIEKEERQQCDEPRKWFVRYAYRRTHYGDYAPPTQWYQMYDIIECDDATELTQSKLYSKLRKELLFPNSKDDVNIRIFDIHKV